MPVDVMSELLWKEQRNLFGQQKHYYNETTDIIQAYYIIHYYYTLGCLNETIKKMCCICFWIYAEQIVYKWISNI